MKTRNDLTDLAQRLIQRAAHKAPPALAARLEEEWLADLASRSGSLARLRLAAGCYWATAIITRECQLPQLAAAGVSGAHKPLLGELRPDLPLLSRRGVAFILIAAVHVLLIYAFTTGLAHRVVVNLPELTHAVFLDPVQPARPNPPPISFTPSLVKPIAVDIPVPQIVENPPDALIPSPTTTPSSTHRTEPPVSRPVLRVSGGPGAGFPATDEYYPATSRRLAETGVAVVGVCVNSQGRLTAAPTLVTTSGSARLDEGALNLARAGSGHYRPTTEDNQPVSACYSYRVRFTLK